MWTDRKDKRIAFVKSGRGKARNAPDPAYPNGVEMNMNERRLCCLVELPYPAPECGYWRVECSTCGLTVAITAAGRPDDPVRVKVPCQGSGSAVFN